MTYELAKQLKEAKFPQGEELYCQCAFLSEADKHAQQTNRVYDCKTERVSKPTLEELIEACGEKFGDLVYYSTFPKERSWEALAKWLEPGDEQARWLKSPMVATPTEAVARLWLSLQTK